MLPPFRFSVDPHIQVVLFKAKKQVFAGKQIPLAKTPLVNDGNSCRSYINSACFTKFFHGVDIGYGYIQLFCCINDVIRNSRIGILRNENFLRMT